MKIPAQSHAMSDHEALPSPVRSKSSFATPSASAMPPPSAMRPASPTLFNPPHIGPHRRIDWLRFDLDAVREVRRRSEGTLNDVVLATVAGALRSHLRAHRVATAKLDLRVMCPVNMRHAGETAGNRVAMLVAPLHARQAVPQPVAANPPPAVPQALPADGIRTEATIVVTGEQPGPGLWLVRSQATVGDVAWMEAMIPHHSIAILTSERAGIRDPRVRALADDIIPTQRREIAEMDALIHDLEADSGR